MQETFIRLNDYTLLQQIDAPDEKISIYGEICIRTRITRTFNFLAAQMTTVTRDLTYEGRGREAGGSSSVSTQAIIQNFSDIQSDGEIRLMHEKLKALKGSPPPLEDVMPSAAKATGKPALRMPGS
jgi:hypothetical protein